MLIFIFVVIIIGVCRIAVAEHTHIAFVYPCFAGSATATVFLRFMHE